VTTRPDDRHQAAGTDARPRIFERSDVGDDGPLAPGVYDLDLDYYYNTSWQVLEIRKDADADPLKQYVWDARYIDAPVVRFYDDDVDGTDVVQQYYTNDANMNVTALVAADGDVVERYMYDPYGNVTVLDGADAADGLAADRILAAAEGVLPEDIAVEVAQTDALLAASHFALAVSGTVTLHAAWFGVPMVVVFRAGRLAYYTIGKCVIRTPNLSLVNILAG
jgi:hypothetical protein